MRQVRIAIALFFAALLLLGSGPGFRSRRQFEEHFAKELAALAPFAADGLVKFQAAGLEITDAGRLFIRNIAMCFDNTLAPAGERRHSKTI